MDDPVHRHLRPTPGNGLTSPDPVTAPDGRTAIQVPAPEPETRTSRRTGERQNAHGHIRRRVPSNQPPARAVALKSGRRIEA